MNNVNRFVSVYLILICFSINLIAISPSEARAPSNFYIVSTSATILGPSQSGSIVSMNASSYYALCEVHNNTLAISVIDIETKKIISTDEYEFAAIGKFWIASSKSGNVKYTFDFENNTFFHGQVNVLLENGSILTKASMGNIVEE